MERIVVKELIKSDSATSPEKAKPLYDLIIKSINDRQLIIIDFSNLTTITTAFFNSSIGNLYSAYPAKILNQFVRIDPKTLTKLQYEKLKLVMHNAKSKLSEADIREEID